MKPRCPLSGVVKQILHLPSDTGHIGIVVSLHSMALRTWKHVLAKTVVEPRTCKITLSNTCAERLHGQGAEGPFGNETVRSRKKNHR